MPLSVNVAGSVTRYQYDTRGLVTQVTNPANETTNYGYNTAGNLTLIRDNLNRETRFTYDTLGRLITIQDPGGAVTRFVYTAACATCGTATELLTEVVDASNRSTRFEYNEVGRLTAEIDPAGNRTSYSYDLNRNIVGRTNPQGTTLEYAYDANDLLVSKVLPGETVTFDYDEMNNLKTAVDADSNFAFQYDFAQRRVNMDINQPDLPQYWVSQDYKGFDKTRAFTNLGWRGFGPLRNNLNLPNQILDSIGTTFDVGYDALLRRTSIGTTGSTTNYSYDLASRLKTLDGPAFPGLLNYVYDTVGRRVQADEDINQNPVVDATLDLTTVTASPLTVTGQVTGNVSAVTVNGNVMSMDAAGNIQGSVPLVNGQNTLDIVVSDARGRTAQLARNIYLAIPTTDANISAVVAISATGDIYVVENGGNGALIPAGAGTLERPPWLAQARDIAVDANNVVYTLEGQTIWRYDGVRSQLVDLSALGTVNDIEVAFGNRLFAAIANQLYEIDGQGVATVITSIPNVSSFQMDASSWGLVIQGDAFYKVDNAGVLTSLPNVPAWLFGFAVSPTGTICGTDFESFVCYQQDGTSNFLPLFASSSHFDTSDTLFYTQGADNVYRFDGTTSTAVITNLSTVFGTLTLSGSAPNTAFTSMYTYDPRDQLASVTVNGAQAETYGYDAVGNRLADVTASDYTYNNLNQLVSGGGASYTYDANGNRATKTDTGGTTRFTWDAENQLTRIDFADGRVAEYAYDPFGRRIRKRVMDAQGAATVWNYVYDDEDIIAIYDETGQAVMEFTHGPGIDEPLAMRYQGELYYFHADVLGSIVAITDAQDNVVQRFRYDSYGNIVETLDPTFKQPYGFTGREYDEESGLYYYRARYYDPQIGRFVSKDPIGFAGGDTNLYAYVANDPIKRVDPYGEFGVVGATIGGVSAFVGTLATGGSLGDAAINGAIGAISGAIPGAGTLVGAIAQGIGIGTVGNLIGQGIQIAKDPCKSLKDFNTGSLIGSAIGGAISAGRSQPFGSSTAVQVGLAPSNAAISAATGAIGANL